MRKMTPGYRIGMICANILAILFLLLPLAPIFLGAFQTERGIELNDSVLGVNLPSGYVVVPTGIIWNGLAVNTLTFACLSWGVVSIAISARRYSRFTRGRCPRCRYDLRHDFSHGCPECGWRKERGFGGPDGEPATEAAAASA